MYDNNSNLEHFDQVDVLGNFINNLKPKEEIFLELHFWQNKHLSYSLVRKLKQQWMIYENVLNNEGGWKELTL